MKHKIYLNAENREKLIGLISTAFWIEKAKYYITEKGTNIRSIPFEDKYLILKPEWEKFCSTLGIKDELYKRLIRGY